MRSTAAKPRFAPYLYRHCKKVSGHHLPLRQWGWRATGGEGAVRRGVGAPAFWLHLCRRTKVEELTFRELRSSACTVQTRLLSFPSTGVTAEESGALEGDAK